MSKKITQATPEQQSELNNIVSNSVENVKIPRTNRTISVRWIRWGTRRKITGIMQNKSASDELLFLHKIAACIRLNGFWKIKLFYWVVWRWYAYIRQYDESQLSPIIEAAKKKVPAENFYLTTISVIGMTDLMKTMTKTESGRILHEQYTAQVTRSEKKDNG